MKIGLLFLAASLAFGEYASAEPLSVDQDALGYLTDAKYFASPPSAAINSDNVSKRSSALAHWYRYIQFNETSDSPEVLAPVPTEWRAATAAFPPWAKDIAGLRAGTDRVEYKGDFAILAREINEASNWGEVSSEEWRKALRLYSMEKSPDWSQMTPARLKEMKTTVEAAINELKASVLNDTEGFEGSWRQGLDAIFHVPDHADHAEIANVVKGWNDALAILGAAPAPAGAVPAADAPPTGAHGFALTAAKLAGVKNKLIDGVKTSMVALLATPQISPATSAAPAPGTAPPAPPSMTEKDAREAKAVAGLLRQPEVALGSCLDTEIELATMRESWPAVIAEIEKRQSQSFVKIYAAYGRIAASPTDLNIEAEKKSLDLEFGNVVADIIYGARIRRMMSQWNKHFGENLKSLRTAVLEDAVRMREALAILSGIRLEYSIRAWDSQNGYCRVSLQNPTLSLDGGVVKTPKGEFTLLSEINTGLSAAWGESGWTEIEKVSLSSHTLAAQVGSSRGEAELNQAKLLYWAKSSSSSPSPWKTNLMGFRLFANTRISLTAEIPKLIIIASEMEFRSGAHIEIPDKCELTIVCHYLRADSLIGDSQPVPLTVAFGGPGAKLTIFASRASAAPNFVRVVGKGQLRVCSLPKADSPSDAWSDLAADNPKVVEKLTSFWIAANSQFFKKYHEDHSHGTEMELSALLDLMALPPYTQAPSKKDEVDKIQSQIEEWKKAVLGRQIHFVNDPITSKRYPVYYDADFQGKLYLLPDELTIVSSPPFLGALVNAESGHRLQLELKLRARVSEHAKTRGSQLAREYFGGMELSVDLPPNLLRVVFAATERQSLFSVKESPVTDPSAESIKTVVSTPLSYSEIILLGQDMLSNAPSLQRSLTLAMEEDKNGSFTLKNEISYSLPVVLSNAEIPAPLTIKDKAGGCFISNSNPVNTWPLRPLFAIPSPHSREMPLIFEKMQPIAAGKEYDLKTDFNRAFLNSFIQSECVFSRGVTLLELLKINSDPLMVSYPVDVTGFVSARFPNGSGDIGKGNGLDLNRSRIKIEYTLQGVDGAHPYSDSSIAEFRTAHGNVWTFLGYTEHRFSVVVECVSSEAVPEPARKTLTFNLEDNPKVQPVAEEINRELGAR